MSIRPKHSAAGTTIFTVMSALAQEHGAINLSQGFPDFPIDMRLAEHVHEAMLSGHNQYAPMSGLPVLRQAIANDFTGRYGLSINSDTEITITTGATYAIYTAFMAILEPGDEVIVLEPAYDSYIPNIEMCGARAVCVKLIAPDFVVNWDEIRAAVSKRTKAIIINTPHNPTGAVWSRSDWDELAALVAKTGIYVLSDEVYEQLIYDGVEHRTVMQHPALRDRSFALYSFGKVFHNTGWKVGYCIAPPALTTAFRRIHQYLAFSVNTPMQYGISAYLALADRPPVADMLLAKRDYFLQLLQDTPFKVFTPAGGSYFQIASYSDISDEPDRIFAERLTRDYRVATIPVSAFYGDGQDNKLLRFCFAKKEETLRSAVEQLKSVLV